MVKGWPDSAEKPEQGTDPPLAFQPVRDMKAFSSVLAQLMFAIRSGVYPPGTTLPPHKELAEAMCVSRPTVLEAIKMLADAGVLQSRRGAGGGVTVLSWVIPPELLSLTTDASGRHLKELVEARVPIETELALLAAARATEQDLEDLRQALACHKPEDSTDAEWHQVNNLYHFRIGRAAHSPVLAHFQHVILDEISVLLGGFSPWYETREEIMEHHVETYEAIASRDPARVRAAMRVHLEPSVRIAARFDPGTQPGTPPFSRTPA
jgi:DNA-binding FadR family transcriptional regulator